MGSIIIPNNRIVLSIKETPTGRKIYYKDITINSIYKRVMRV